MLSAVIHPGLSYSAMHLAAQLTHQRSVHPGPLVLGTAPLKMRYPFHLRVDCRPLGDDQVDRPEVEVG